MIAESLARDVQHAITAFHIRQLIVIHTHIQLQHVQHHLLVHVEQRAEVRLDIVGQLQHVQQHQHVQDAEQQAEMHLDIAGQLQHVQQPQLVQGVRQQVEVRLDTHGQQLIAQAQHNTIRIVPYVVLH